MIESIPTKRHSATTLIVLAALAAACGTTQTATPSFSPGSTIRPTQGATPPRTFQPGTPPTATATPSSAGTPTVTPSIAPSQPAGSPSDVSLTVELLAEGLPPLTFLTHAGDGSGVLYAVGQNGVISALSATGDVQPEPFLDIDDRITSGGEQGLLGMAFHPEYESNGRLFVNYTDNNGDTIISEFGRSAARPGLALADPALERILLTIDQPFPNHNGGMIAFGPDGHLYIGMGDGGGGGDPQGNGQAMTSLLGKMLRIDVNSGDPYGIPVDNPFIDAGLPEIWALGLRNPWRFSFDRETGDLFIGDVGQRAQEEIDAEPAGAGGRNYGWNIMEGDQCYRTDPCVQTGLTLPVYVNDRSHGECAIIGGYVYRGAQFPDLLGTYVFSDNCSPALWILDAQTAIDTGEAEGLEVGTAGTPPSSFGEDEEGELYLVNLRGEIYRLVSTRS